MFVGAAQQVRSPLNQESLYLLRSDAQTVRHGIELLYGDT